MTWRYRCGAEFGFLAVNKNGYLVTAYSDADIDCIFGAPGGAYYCSGCGCY